MSIEQEKKKNANPSKLISVLSFFKDICLPSLHHQPLYSYFHPVGKPGLTGQSHAGFPWMTSMWKPAPSGQCVAVTDYYSCWLLECVREKTIWTGCEWLRLLLEVSFSHAAELPWSPPAEEILQEDTFPCIKGTRNTSPLPRSVRGFPTYGEMEGSAGRCLPHRKEGPLKLHQH